jgi:glycosyltransferase involved in cell wall biosynthesis
MKTSVIMASYNGEAHILEQMESIRNQSQPADEVIICDDGSGDRTVTIIQEYIEENRLDTWTLHRNETNKGFTMNFLDGAELATGDILFYSDQDDVWDKEKIRHMCQAMEEKNALAVYCLANTIDSDGNIQKNQMSKITAIPQKKRVQEVSLSEKLKYAKSPGLCLAFKKEILPEVRRMAVEYDLPHDTPVGTVAAIKGTYCVINEPLVSHRIYSGNLSAPDTRVRTSFQNMNRQIGSRTLRLHELQAVNGMYRENLSEKEKKMLDDAIEKTTVVLDCLQKRKTGGIWKAVFSRNKMMNRALAVRNLLAILYDRGKQSDV